MLIVFTRQLYILIKAGVPLLKALQIIHVQLAAGKFKESLDFIIHEIQDGRSFSEALIAHPKFFSLFYINMIKAAEVSGNLVAVLKELSVHLIEHRRLNRQVQSAIMYPVFILLTATSILLVLLVFVLPVFTRIFQDLGANLPPATQFLVWVSNLLLRWGWLVLIVGALAGVTIFTLARRPRGRAILDGLFWRIPLFGKIYKTMEIARLCRTIGTLLTSGVVLIKALEVLIDITPAVLLRQGL
ncbi:MAG: type II secretion system F family protein, partial [Candidatus Omnitrophica bacterium]|nr:type II secretion system F family protein [Candidatus Omnitrophota bacterium]